MKKCIEVTKFQKGFCLVEMHEISGEDTINLTDNGQYFTFVGDVQLIEGIYCIYVEIYDIKKVKIACHEAAH